MRRAIVTIVLVTALASQVGPAAAASTFTTVVDWTEGTFLVGLPSTDTPLDTLTIEGPARELATAEIDVPVGQCHRRLEVDVEYEPHEADVGTDDVGAALPYLFNVTLVDPAGHVVRSLTLDAPRHNVPLGEVPGSGPYVLELRLALGADVDWRVRVQGWAVAGEPACA